MAAVAVKIDNDRAPGLRRQIPGKQRQPVLSREHRLAHTKLVQPEKSRTGAVRMIKKLPLKDVKSPDQSRITDHGKSEKGQHAREPEQAVRRRGGVRLRACAA